MTDKTNNDMELEDFVRMLNMTSYEGVTPTGEDAGSNYYEGFKQVPREFDLEVSDFYDDEDDDMDRGTFRFMADYDEKEEDKRDFFAEYSASMGLGAPQQSSHVSRVEKDPDADLDVVDLEDDIEIEEEEPEEELVLNESDVFIYNAVMESLRQAIETCNEHLRKHRIECAPLLISLENADNLIKVRELTNDYAKNAAFAVVVDHLEKMCAYLLNLDKKIHEYAKSDAEITQKKAMLEKMMDINDGNILKLDEGIMKVWNLMPKNKTVKKLVMQLEHVSAVLFELANSFIDDGNISLRYYALNLITDNRNKIIDEYEYLPFVRHAKAVEYKQELEGLKKSLDMTKIHYITVMDEEKARIKAIEYEMDDCSHSLENWNVFSKNNKKQSRERLAALEKEEQEAKAKLENLITEFDSMVKQISDNIELCESKLRWYRG